MSRLDLFGWSLEGVHTSAYRGGLLVEVQGSSTSATQFKYPERSASALRGLARADALVTWVNYLTSGATDESDCGWGDPLKVSREVGWQIYLATSGACELPRRLADHNTSGWSIG